MSANVCASTNYGIFTYVCRIGDARGRMNGADQRDTGFYHSLGVGLPDAIIPDSDECGADAQF